jgi:S-adenosylmethionine:tRNA ribosyltransferase-isomerase
MNLAGYLPATEPAEARGLARDGVRMLVGRPGAVTHHVFSDLPSLLRPGDVLVVNTSTTMPAAVGVIGDSGVVLHFSALLDDGRWVVELRRDLMQTSEGVVGQRFELKGGAWVTLEEAFTPRLWLASTTVTPPYLAANGHPIRYSYVDREWPISFYRTVFSDGSDFGSAEMPSAARPFTEALVTRLVSRGVLFAPISLHTGVASPEAHEKPYPERFSVPATTAGLINQTRATGGRVIAVGTTAVRAVESAAAPSGVVSAASGWTDLVVNPTRGVHAIDGLLTGLHEPRASHLMMLEAIAGAALLERCYREAVASGYLWHEFGDVNLLLPARLSREPIPLNREPAPLSR